jgi:hypothetical protein
MAISLIETASLDTGLVAPTATALTTASGSAPSYSARAWVNFDGTGTVAIRSSGNVTSITDNGTGDYTVNFTIAMADANYSYFIQSQVSASLTTTNTYNPTTGTLSTTSMIVRTWSDNNVQDNAIVCVSIFR